jgi:hypothetical protein
MAVNLDSLKGVGKTVYSSLLAGFKSANNENAATFNPDDYITKTAVTDTKTGEVYYQYNADTSAIASFTSNSLTSSLENAAYLFASVIDNAIQTGKSEIDLTDLVKKSGDSMLARLYTLYGFSAGYDNNTYLSVDDNKVGIYAPLTVSKDTTIKGSLSLSDSGIYFSEHQCVYYDSDKLQLGADTNLHGNLTLDKDKSISLGSLTISNKGVELDGSTFYHSGNCNNSTTDWNMQNGNVAKNLTINGTISSLYGFSFGENGEKTLYSDGVNTVVNNRLFVSQSYSLGSDEIISYYNDTKSIISFSAPGKVLNLGDNGTSNIALQTNLYVGSDDRAIITTEGKGTFKSINIGLSDQSLVFQSANDGVIVKDYLYLGSTKGATISQNDTAISFGGIGGNINLSIADGFVLAGQEEKKLAQFSTNAQFYSFDKPIQSEYFAIKSDEVKTTLQAGKLFLNGEMGITAGEDYLRLDGETHINKDLGTSTFRSGYNGSGWRISDSCATFDELVVRKKMKVFELEVSKQTVTNGSLWVSDSCSGDYLLD